VLAKKDEGQSRVTAASDCVNALNASTTLEGRDAVRQQLRQLRERWDQCSDRIAAAEQILEKMAACWTAFNKQCDKLERWLAMIQSKLTATVLHNTLQQKKDQLHTVKVMVVV